MTPAEAQRAIGSKNTVITAQKKSIHSLTKQITKAECAARLPLLDLLEKAAAEDDVYKLAHELVLAHGTGKLGQLPSLALQAVTELIHNSLAKGPRGRDHGAKIHKFFEVLLIWGKPRVAQWVGDNLHPYSIDTMREDIRKLPVYEFGVLEQTFIAVAAIYKRIMKGNHPWFRAV